MITDFASFRFIAVQKSRRGSLAQVVEATYTTDLSSVVTDAQLYIVSLKDAAFVQLLPEIVARKKMPYGYIAAGSIPMDVWADKVNRYWGALSYADI